MKRLLLIVFALLAELDMWSADSELTFRRLTIAEGLSQNTVRAIAQDAQGNIWLGTQNGLNRYDGYGFKCFYSDLADSAAIADNAIFSLLSGSSHRLWIGTASTLSWFDFAENRFHNIPSPGRKHVYSLLEDEDGLAVATDDGLWFFDLATRAFRQVEALSGCQIRALFRNEDALLLATKSGLARLSGNEVTWIESLRGLDVSSIAQIGGTGWWIATHGNGLLRTDSNFGIMRRFGKRNGSLPSDYIRVLKTDAYGRLWAGTYDGLAVYDDLTGRFDCYFHDETQTSLGHNSIWSLFVDNQKGVWVGTWFGGVNYWNRQAARVRNISLSAPGVNGFVSCLAAEADGDGVWIGTNDDGLFHWNATSGELKPWTAPGMSANIKCVLPCKDGSMFVGTHLGGLVRVDSKTGRATGNWQVRPEIPIYNGCYSLLRDSDKLWTGTPDGLFLFDIRTKRFSLHPVVIREPRLAHLLVSQLLRDRKGRVWIGTDAGLFRVEEDGDTVRSFESLQGGSDLTVTCLREASDGIVWVATNRGLLRFMDEEGKVYSVRDGLPNDYVCGILEDASRQLWLSTGGGICSMDPSTESFHMLRDQRINEFTVGACCSCADGAFCFGGLAGVTRFRPLDQGINPFAPAPYISDVTTPGADRCTRRRREDGNLTDVVIAPDVNMFSVSFSVVNLLSNDNRFAYRLEGFDSAWYETQLRSVRYSNLSPGRYVFHLKAANSDGRWSRDEVVLSIRVEPHWWQTVWARLLFIIMALSLIALVVWFAVSRFKIRMQLQIERIEREQIESNLMRTRDMLMHSYSSAKEDSEPVATSADEDFLRRAIKVVEDNIDNENFSSQDFADAMHMSRSSLYLRITSVTGESAIQFIRKIRLTRACQMLLERRWTVAEISSKVGFSSPSYFATAFKKYVGCPPAEYGKK